MASLSARKLINYHQAMYYPSDCIELTEASNER